MAQLQDRTGDLVAFVSVVDAGSFSAAASRLDVAPSSLSRAVARLEQRVGTRLLRRTTRRLDLTPEGERFYDRVVRILADLEEAESDIRVGSSKPRGRLRVSVPVPFALHQLIPRLHRLTARYPDLEVDVGMTDTLVDLLEDRTDVAIRIAPLTDSTLYARVIAECGLHLVAAPAYLASRGLPTTPADLEAGYEAVRFSALPALNEWRLREADGSFRVIRPRTRIAADNGEAVRQLVLQGHGMARLSAFMVEEDLRTGRLVEVLPDANPGDRQIIHAVYPERAGNSARLKVFLDFLRQEFAAGNWSTASSDIHPANTLGPVL